MSSIAQKAARMREDELTTGSERWWYISFADEKGFLGGCLVRAFGPTDALLISHDRRINQGGQAMVILVPDDAPAVKPEHANRLLSLADMERLGLMPAPLTQEGD